MLIITTFGTIAASQRSLQHHVRIPSLAPVIYPQLSCTGYKYCKGLICILKVSKIFEVCKKYLERIDTSEPAPRSVVSRARIKAVRRAAAEVKFWQNMNIAQPDIRE